MSGDATAKAVEQLTELGFSQYEARAYVGLLGSEPMTGYALANRTGIPQPKVYETLRRLEEKDAVVRVGDNPARFLAVPSDQLLAQVDAGFRARVAESRRSLAEVSQGQANQRAHVLPSLSDWESVAATASGILRRATQHVYLSAHADQLTPLEADISDAQDRGVRFDILCFGPSPVTVHNGRTVQHTSTEGVLYRHHQARHLAVVADNHDTLWALAPDGHDWAAAVINDPLFTAVVKGYIRHDLYVQQIYADFPDELRTRYGPGLQHLVQPSNAGEPPLHGRSETRPRTA
ncbi:TrmB family transcriptional regulator [Streptomyces djakartensis]|uniref:Transcriptional regulator n=1 Tax=Streptomyces djakartensis TaxID=68193 RepID=A0ABQ3A5S1_9ACTN|nr:helix-turn-helix domain-containing protein [Streptomyces djakartensis]GGY33160.1 transcriptional regulator [Streptomyces djakartensis]